MAEVKKRLYQGAYRSTLDDPANSNEEPTSASNTSTEDPATPEERTWQKRYGDLRSYNTTLTKRVDELESQLRAAQRQEVKIPSTKEELDDFSKKYPDVYRHIRSIAMSELLQERENISQDLNSVKAKLQDTEMELGKKRILSAHPDFEELNSSQDFHDWALRQPPQIQEWLFESSDPDLCIKALDFYKSETKFKAKKPQKTPGADVQIRTRTPVETPEMGDKKIWKASEIGALSPKQFEQVEAEIERANVEGRIDLNA